MNLFEKLATARVELQSMGLKKSGHNKFAGYKYYELADFLPEVNNLCSKHKMCPITTFTEFGAEMTIYDAESSDRISFTTSIADATTKGQLPIQSLGSVHTYIRRYLYMLAFEIVESDYVDATTNPAEVESAPKPVAVKVAPPKPAATPVPSNPELISEVVRNKLWEEAKAKGHNAKTIKDVLAGFGYNTMTEIPQTKLFDVRTKLGLNNG